MRAAPLLLLATAHGWRLPTSHPTPTLLPTLLPTHPAPTPRLRTPLLLDTTNEEFRLVAVKLKEENTQLREENSFLKQQNSELLQREEDRLEAILNAKTVARLARRTLLRNIATINLLVICSFGIGIAYSVLETDIRAIFALYYYELGDDLYPSFARSVVAFDLLLRLPGELLQQYEALVQVNPIFYKVRQLEAFALE